jgi:putative hemolysin
MGRLKVGLVVVLGLGLVSACTATESPRPTGVGAGATGQVSSAAAGATAGASEVGFDTAAADKYCTDQGGMLVDRVATWNANADPSAWLELAGRMRLCEFETAAGDAPTRISVDLVTLYSEEPTLAGLAYLSKVPPTLPKQSSANPAAYNCMQGLAGTSQFGNTPGSGGGWVDKTQPVFVVMSLCMFADGSAIDEWGITYYANGDVRGADLATKMRYKPTDPLPAVFVPTKGN